MHPAKYVYLLAALTLQSQSPVQAPETVPLYRVTVVQSSAKAINYRFLKSSTKIDFKGTVLAPSATGMAKISNEATSTHIKASFEGLPAPTQFGPEYLTYVLWGVSTEGRATNLGEILLKHGEGKLKASESLQSFGLMVTAEPYFAVTQPSDVVVLENALRPGSEGTTEVINAKVDLIKRGNYNMNASLPEPVPMQKDTPFAVYQARNAVAIAKAAGGETYASVAFAKAEQQLLQAEAKDSSTKAKVAAARESIQSAEDARQIAVKRQETDRLESERVHSQAKVDRAEDKADRANDRADRANADLSTANADLSSAKTDRTVALQENSNLKNEANQSASALAQANIARDASLQENANLRAQLRDQLSAILETRDTARGLIVSMSGVTFKPGQATLLPAAREKLSKIAGLLLTHPGLKVESEGYTDNTGSDEVNQALSERRAEAARNYLVSQGISPDAIVHRGFGKASPVDSNDTSEGRKNNRRVELVVSGQGITSSPRERE
jgi:outer membrane protein OmpA-like peptidoglycan-associated protein